jgi:hypothetical protein
MDKLIPQNLDRGRRKWIAIPKKKHLPDIDFSAVPDL